MLIRPKQRPRRPHLPALDIPHALSLPLVSAPLPCRLALRGRSDVSLDRQIALIDGCAAVIRNAYAVKAFLLEYLYRCQGLLLGRTDDRDGGTVTGVCCFNDKFHCHSLYRVNADNIFGRPGHGTMNAEPNESLQRAGWAQQWLA